MQEKEAGRDSYKIRNYRNDDFNEYVKLRREAAKLRGDLRHLSPQYVTEFLARPNHSPAHDLFVVEVQGGLAGYLDTGLDTGINRAVLDVWIQPKHRRRGLGKKLFRQALSRAREAGVRVVQVNVAESNRIARTVLERLGFRCVRKFLEMKLNVETILPKEMAEAARQCCSLKRGDEAELTRVQNRSFGGTWGYNPNTVETITYRLNLSHSNPEDILVTYESSQVVGYCWTEIAGGEMAPAEKEGRIYMLGVDPDFRERGLSKKLLLAGLSRLKDRGVRLVLLTVDSENEPAYRLYHSSGFKPYASSLWYEKVVTQETGAI